MSWHTDEDVPLYGTAPAIASISFGATRRFVLRRMTGKPYAEDWRPASCNEMVDYSLVDGSLLVMRGATQRHWEHSVCKEARCTGGARINITFRQANDIVSTS